MLVKIQPIIEIIISRAGKTRRHTAEIKRK
jgi:hypothetical protein